MRKKTILLLIGLITCLSFSFTFKASYGALSQDWIVTADFKNDHPRCLGIDSSGNIYVAGYTDNISSSGGKIIIGQIEYDIFLLKYDSLGAQQWNKTYKANRKNICYDLILDSQDNVYLVGYTSLDGDSLLLIKYDSSGHLQWNKTWGENVEGASIKIDSSNNIFVCGTHTIKNDIFLQKYDTSGIILWNRTWETPERYVANSMVLDSTTNIYIGGITCVNESIPSVFNIALVKYNSLGEFQWNLTCQSPNTEYCRDIIADSLDNIYILGGSSVNSEIQLRKYNNTGNSIWNATWENSEADNYGLGLAIDASDYVYITGSTRVSGSTFILVLKYDSTGNLKWNYIQGSLDYRTGYAIKIDSSKNIYICGTINIVNNTSDYIFDVFLLKLSEESPQAFIPSYNIPIVILSVFGIGIAFYVKKRKSFL